MFQNKWLRRLALLFVILIIISTIFYLENQRVKPKSIDIEDNTILKEGKYPKAPELRNIHSYLNTEPITISELEGKVVLIDFWTYSCINCIRTLPHLTNWDEKYRDKGLVIIGVHTPEFEFEKNIENVKMALEKYNINYPVVLDNDYGTWSAYMNRYWPNKFLIDKDGFIRYNHIGEGAYKETEKVIQELLAETGTQINTEISNIQDSTPRRSQTPELYAGYKFNLPRGQNLGNEIGLQQNQIANYQLPEQLYSDRIYLEGKWKSNPDDLQALSESSIILGFTASSVNIVASGSEIEVLINDKPLSEEQLGKDVIIQDGKSIVKVNEPRLYNLFNGEYGNHKLTLKVKENFSFNAFTFG